MLRGCERSALRGYRSVRGYLGRLQVRIVHTGVGGCHYRPAVDELLAAGRWSRVVGLGTAAALEPSIDIGDVVVADRPISWRPSRVDGWEAGEVPGAVHSEPDRPGVRQAMGEESFKICRGAIVTWDRAVLDRRTRSRAAEVSRALCVDMESGHAARLCADHGLRFLAVRGISDLADGLDREDRLTDLRTAIAHATLVAIAALCDESGEGSRSGYAWSRPSA